MVLVDTSVMIGYLKGNDHVKIRLLDEIIKKNIPYGFSIFTYQEVLQGARDEYEFNKLRAYLSTQKIYFLANKINTYEKAAELYFFLRKKGITTRSTIDILIALTAIENNLSLLHNDRDFDMMATVIDTLSIFETI